MQDEPVALGGNKGVGRAPVTRRPRALVIGLFVLAVLLSGGIAAAQGPQPSPELLYLPGGAGPEEPPSTPPPPEDTPPPQAARGHSVKNDVSPPLRWMDPILSSPGSTVREIPLRPLLRKEASRRVEDLSEEPIRDRVLQDWSGAARMPSPIQGFEGVNNNDNQILTGSAVLPPDTNGDVGPNHYVQWVNNSFAIWNKSGTLLYGPAAGNTLWSGFGGACQTQNDGDPIVLYDPLADRWMMSQFALPDYPNGPFYQCIAVSQTPDPTGAWHRYAFLAHNTKMNDYPKFGVWPDGYYMSVNQFSSSGAYAGAGAFVFDRANMLAGNPATFQYFDLNSVNPDFFGMLPSDLDGATPPPAGTPNYFVEVDDSSWIAPSDALRIWEFHVDWTTPANSTFGLSGQPNAVLSTDAFDPNMCFNSVNCIPQPGTTRRLDAISDRLMYRLQYRNFGTHESLVVNHTVDVDGADHAGIRWYELRDPGGSSVIYQQGTYAPDASHRWMGSIAMDGNGNMALGYTVSSSTVYPSIRYTGRLTSDPLGAMPQGEETFMAGGGSQTHSSSRWGDYSMMAVDPVDDCTFWYTQEYYQTTSSSGWRTRIGSFKFPSCASTPNLSTSAKGVSSAIASPGGLLTYTVTLSNTANMNASTARLTDILPLSVTYVSGSATGGAIYDGASRSIAWMGVVTAASALSLTYSAIVTSPLDNGTAITNTATVYDGVNAPFETAPVTTTISSSPNLSTSAKRVSSAIAGPGGVLTYSVTLSNTGNMNASTARLTDTLPLSLTYVSGSATGGAIYDGASRSVAWMGVVTAASALSLTYSAIVASPVDNGTAITNTATIYDGVNAPFETAPVTTTIDVIAPGGSLEVNGGASYSNAVTATLTLSATDNVNSALSMTFSNDGTTWSEWEAFSTAKSWPLASVPDGTRTVYGRFRDAVGNVSSTYSDTITLDTSPPSGAVIINDGASGTNSTLVSLTVSAQDPLSGVSSMQFSDDGQDSGVWEEFTTAKWWRIPSGDGAKTVYGRFQDGVGNVSALVSAIILLDTAPPSSNVESLGSYANAAQFAVAWSGLDQGSGLASFDIQYRDGSLGPWTDWITNTLPATSGAGFVGTDGNTYYFRSRAKDKAGNAEAYPGGDGDTLTTVDLAPPMGKVSINSEAVDTTAAGVTLSLSATDSLSGISQASYSGDGSTWDNWETFSALKTWTLSSGDGAKAIYARFRDAAGNISAAVSDTINLDTSARGLTGVGINDGALFTNKITVTLSLPAPASTSEMILSNDGAFGGATWEPFSAYKSWQLTQYGSYVLPRTVYARYKDVNGNISSTLLDDIILDVNAPAGSVSIEGAGVASMPNASASGTGIRPGASPGGRGRGSATTFATLRLFASDDLSGVGGMILSNSPSFAGAAWEPFASNKPWSLDSGGKVFVNFKDNAGNASPIYAVTVTGAKETLPAAVLGTAHPKTGGQLDSPETKTTIAFPPGSFEAKADVTLVPAVEPNQASNTGSLTGIGKFFTLTAKVVGSDVTTVSNPYTITVGYTGADMFGVDESTLRIYWWNGIAWQKEPNSRVDTAGKTVSASLSHMSSFAVLGVSPIRKTYLPLLAKNSGA